VKSILVQQFFDIKNTIISKITIVSSIPVGCISNFRSGLPTLIRTSWNFQGYMKGWQPFFSLFDFILLAKI
jgi:hypothetical protein